MTEQKSFQALFPRYELTREQADYMKYATGIRRLVQKDANGQVTHVQVYANFTRHVPRDVLAAVEAGCRSYYELLSFRIYPTYSPNLFRLAYMEEIAQEAVERGAFTLGFFEGAKYEDDGETVTALIPYLEEGVEFVSASGAEDALSEILKLRYGVVRRVVITSSPDAEEKARARREELDRMLREYELMAQQATPAQEEKVTFDRVAADVLHTIPSAWEQVGKREWKMGHMQFSAEEPGEILGPLFETDALIPLAAVKDAMPSATLMGEVFSVNARESRNKEKINYTVGITDGIHSIFLKLSGEPSQMGYMKEVKEGVCLAVQGKIARDRFDDELVCMPRAMMKIRRVRRMDNAPEKRVELHLHTTMSKMDAYIEPKELIETAARWGWSAIAVTDHGTVQAFPEVMLANEKMGNPVKVLWGTEAYLVNDKERAIFGTALPSFEDEMVVFDIETTGLSAKSDAITEIGAVKISRGQVVDTFDTFVNPERPIPPEITELTSITDEMVADAPTTAEALESFFAFVGDRMLIAHNASFDCGFIRAAADACGMSFPNTYLDTLCLSRFVNPELRQHKLNLLAEHYGLGDFHHHRAEDDARMLAEIFFHMIEQLKKEGVSDFATLGEAMSEKADPLKLTPRHAVIFAKNQVGLKNLYRLISASYLDYFRRFPRIPRSLLEQHREGLIVGSACEAGELYQAFLSNQPESVLEEIASFYDYLEIQPLCNNAFLVGDGRVADLEAIKDINRRIVALGDKLGKPVVATCDAHFLEAQDELYRKIILAGMKFDDADRDTGIYLRTTDEMLAEFAYLGEETARRVVIEAPRQIAEMCEEIRPIPHGTYTPKMEGAEEELTTSCWRRAEEWYGYDDGSGVKIPDIVSQRLEKELSSIIEHGFAVLYMIAVRLVAYSESQGYLVGSRGSVGSSVVASMSGISEVNPLPPHYRCPKCRYSEFFTDGSVGSGFDLPDAVCPKCGTPYLADGHDIPFETFLGFKGDKSPDIDLNFSGDVQGRVHKYTEELFGAENVFRAGTTATLADKTAYGYVAKYLEDKKISLSRAEMDQLTSRTKGVKRTTGQHPGGIIVVPKEMDIHDFTPVQHPADDPKSTVVTTHFQFEYLHDTILKLDELGHDIPTKYKMLETYTNTSVMDVKMNDPRVYQLFESTAPLGITPEDIGGCQLGTYGLPEMGTHFIQSVLMDAKPKNFADLLQISGLTHGTDVWLGNAQDLIRDGVCDISKVIGTRDGIMLDLIRYGLSNSDAFTIMESVRKGRGLKLEWETNMREHGVPDWYISSCKKIKYMFPKAHAAAYVMSAIRLGWYKIVYPMEFYAAFLSVAPGGFDAKVVMGGRGNVRRTIDELGRKPPEDTTANDKAAIATLQLVEESMARGVRYLPPHLYKSHDRYFLPEDGCIRMPFSALGGIGETAAQRLVEVREEGDILSVEDLRVRAGLSKTVVELLRGAGALDGLSETNQYSFF